MNRHILWGSVTGGVVLSDQLTKYAVQRFLEPYSRIEIIPGVCNLTYIINTGGAFGLFGGLTNPWRILLFVGISIIALVILLIFYMKYYTQDTLTPLAIALIAGGAMGNFIDRIRYNGVIDFIDLHYGRYHWPAFNVADMGITIGVVIILVHQILIGTRECRANNT